MLILSQEGNGYIGLCYCTVMYSRNVLTESSSQHSHYNKPGQAIRRLCPGHEEEKVQAKERCQIGELGKCNLTINFEEFLQMEHTLATL